MKIRPELIRLLTDRPTVDPIIHCRRVIGCHSRAHPLVDLSGDQTADATKRDTRAWYAARVGDRVQHVKNPSSFSNANAASTDLPHSVFVRSLCDTSDSLTQGYSPIGGEYVGNQRTLILRYIQIKKRWGSIR